MVSPDAFRSALGSFATGVTVVTAKAPDGSPLGVTVSALSSLSLEPPLVLYCLGRRTANADSYLAAGRFAINVLAEGQRALSETFAGQGDDKFAGVEHSTGDNGCPILSACAATLECTITDTFDGGDHIIVVGHVDKVSVDGSQAPLLHFRGAYAALGQSR